MACPPVLAGFGGGTFAPPGGGPPHFAPRAPATRAGVGGAAGPWRAAARPATMCVVAIQGATRSGMANALTRAAVAALVCCVILAGMAGAAQAQLSWSAPIPVNKVSGLSLTALACPSATQCTAL